MSIIADVVAELTATPFFLHGTKSWQNLKSDQIDLSNGIVYLDEPITSDDTLEISDALTERYAIKMFFGEKVEQKQMFDFDEHHAVALDMRAVRRQFINKLKYRPEIDSITNVKTVEWLNEFMANISGVVVYFTAVCTSTSDDDCEEQELPPPEPQVGTLDVSLANPIPLLSPFFGESFVNVSVSDSIVGNTDLVEKFTAENTEIAWFTGDGNTMWYAHYVIDGDGYNFKEQEILYRGQTLADAANGVGNQTYNRDFFTEFCKTVHACGIPYVVTSQSLFGILSRYSSEAGAEPGLIDWDNIPFNEVIDDIDAMLAIMAEHCPNAILLMVEFTDESILQGNRPIFDNQFGAEHGADVYRKVLTHTNGTSAVSILQHLKNVSPETLAQADAIIWTHEDHDYFTTQGDHQNWDQIVFDGNDLVDVVRQYDQIKDDVALLDYQGIRQDWFDSRAAFYNHLTAAEYDGKPSALDQVGTDTPEPGGSQINRTAAKGLILAERMILTWCNNHLHGNCVKMFCNYNQKVMFDIGDGWEPRPAYKYRKLMGEWYEGGGDLIDITVSDPALDDLLIKGKVVNGLLSIVVLNPTAGSFMIPTVSIVGQPVESFTVKTVHPDSTDEPTTVFDAVETTESNQITVHPYALCVAFIELS